MKQPKQIIRWQRVENALIALGVVVVMLAAGQPWWILLVAFLAFDLSALGYLINQQVAAFMYNLVHNYAVPATLVSGWAALQLTGFSADWLLLLSCCWGFHVAVDRAVGYGLKIGPFRHTHLGMIAGDKPASDTAAAA